MTDEPDPEKVEQAMKAAHGAANPGGPGEAADQPSGVRISTPDAPLTNGGDPVPSQDQERG